MRQENQLFPEDVKIVGPSTVRQPKTFYFPTNYGSPTKWLNNSKAGVIKDIDVEKETRVLQKQCRSNLKELV